MGRRPYTDIKHGVKAPKFGAAFHIWQICKNLQAKFERPPTRAELLAVTRKVQLEDNYVSVQFFYWRKYHGIKTREYIKGGKPAVVKVAAKPKNKKNKKALKISGKLRAKPSVKSVSGKRVSKPIGKKKSKKANSNPKRAQAVKKNASAPRTNAKTAKSVPSKMGGKEPAPVIAQPDQGSPVPASPRPVQDEAVTTSPNLEGYGS